jgi:hypothetical protein
MLQPEVYTDHIAGCILAVALYLASTLIGVVKFHRFANLHLESARYGSVIWYLFIAHTLISGQYSPFLFYLALGTFILSSLEEVVLLLISDEVDEHMRSIFVVWRRRRAATSPGQGSA